MSAAHTPGPWHWDMGYEHGNAMPMLLSPVGPVCDFGNDREYYPTAGEAPNEADSRLISAAPELLAALRLLLLDVGTASSMRGAVKARAAIAKATGEAS